MGILAMLRVADLLATTNFMLLLCHAGRPKVSPKRITALIKKNIHKTTGAAQQPHSGHFCRWEQKHTLDSFPPGLTKALQHKALQSFGILQAALLLPPAR